MALSFVQRASDVVAARTIVGKRAALMSKIEKPAALKDLDDIIAASDGVMVARGDLGLNCRPNWCRAGKNHYFEMSACW